MSQKYFTTLTHIGAALHANAQLQQTTVPWTHLVLGDGNGVEPVPNPAQTGVIHEVDRLAISSIAPDPDNPNWIVVEAVIPADRGGYVVRETALMGGADGNQCIAVGNYPSATKPLLSEGAGSELIIRVVVEVAHTATVTLKIDPAVVIASRDWVEKLEATQAQAEGGSASGRWLSPARALQLLRAEAAQATEEERGTLRASTQDEADEGKLGNAVITPKTLAGVLSAVLPTEIVKADRTAPCLIKKTATTLAIAAGTRVLLPGGARSFFTETAVTMPALTPGEDYSVWVPPSGAPVAVADPTHTPAEPPVEGSVKIGGFHYGLITPGATVASGSFAATGPGMHWTQADVDQIAGINAWSIWDLQWRPKCDPRGMTCVRSDAGLPLLWVDIYFCGTNHIVNGTSRYNTDVASGTVLPRIPLMFGGNGTNTYSKLAWFEAQEIALSHGKRLMSYQEFAAAAFGTTENQSLGGAASTIPATGHTPGYMSKWGIPQVTGHHWTYGDVAHADSGTAWVTGADRGQTRGTPVRALFGGDRGVAASSGSRCSDWVNSAWFSHWTHGLRAACDPLCL